MSEEQSERSAEVSVGEPTQESTRVDEVVGESLPLRQFYVKLEKA